MSVLPDRNIWIPSRVPQTLPCADCGRTSNFANFIEPDRYQYACPACHSMKLFTLTQINANEAHRLHTLPTVAVPPIISAPRAAKR